MTILPVLLMTALCILLGLAATAAVVVGIVFLVRYLTRESAKKKERAAREQELEKMRIDDSPRDSGTGRGRRGHPGGTGRPPRAGGRAASPRRR